MTVQELIDALAAGVRDGWWTAESKTTVESAEDIAHILSEDEREDM